MEFRLNKEGTQYILVLPVKEGQALSSQMILFAGELGWLPSEAIISGFPSLADAQRARRKLRERPDALSHIYQVTIIRLATKQSNES
jgi:hypothetical protein